MRHNDDKRFLDFLKYLFKKIEGHRRPFEIPGQNTDVPTKVRTSGLANPKKCHLFWQQKKVAPKDCRFPSALLARESGFMVHPGIILEL